MRTRITVIQFSSVRSSGKVVQHQSPPLAAELQMEEEAVRDVPPHVVLGFITKFRTN